VVELLKERRLDDVLGHDLYEVGVSHYAIRS
jgi:hypothetical protein